MVRFSRQTLATSVQLSDNEKAPRIVSPGATAESFISRSSDSTP